MPYLLIQHTVEDYDAWKPVFDDHGTTRERAGCLGGQLFCDDDNPDEVTILFEWDSVENARAFAESEDLKKAMQRAGVVGMPKLTYLDQLEALPVSYLGGASKRGKTGA